MAGGSASFHHGASEITSAGKFRTFRAATGPVQPNGSGIGANPSPVGAGLSENGSLEARLLHAETRNKATSGTTDKTDLKPSLADLRPSR